MAAALSVLVVFGCSRSVSNLPAQRAQAMQVFYHGSCAQALPLLAQVVQADPTDAIARLSEGSCFFNSSEYAPAVSSLQAAVELSPTTSNLTLLGQAEWAEGLDTRAVSDLRRAASASLLPQQAVQVAQLLQSYSDAADALKALGKVPVAQRDYTWYDIEGKAYLNLNLYPEAISAFTQSVQLAPPKQEGSVLIDFGDAYWTEDDCTDALTEYGAALVPSVYSQAYVHDQMGLCQQRLGDNESALASYQAALRTQPTADQIATIDLNLLQLDLAMHRSSAASQLEQQMQASQVVPDAEKHQALALLQAAQITASAVSNCPNGGSAR